MTLGEGATFAVLSGQADAMAFGDQRTEGERLRGRPVDALAGLDRLGAVVEEALDGAVKVEDGRHHGDLGADLLERRHRDPGGPAPRDVARLGGLQSRPD